MNIKYTKLNQTGDTMVEVMIAMVILAFVLTGAYLSAQYSLNNIVNANNRVEALDIATGQIESLKNLLMNSPTAISSDQGSFYLSTSNKMIVLNSIPPLSVPVSGKFFYEFKQPMQATNSNNWTFTVYVYWANLSTDSITKSCNVGNLSTCDNVNLSYRAAI
jgi:Tfp pilus assembly protein PilV